MQRQLEDIVVSFKRRKWPIRKSRYLSRKEAGIKKDVLVSLKDQNDQ